MANTEKVGILTHIDDDGNKTELYPVVKTDSTLTTTGTPADAAATGAAVAEATNIAKGRNRARVFATTADMETWLKTAANKGLCNVGDNLYIVQVDVPDWWVSEVLTTADSTTGYYYKIAQLETQKVDLTNYLPKSGYTPERVLISGVNGVVTESGTTSTELYMLHGVTNYVQTQLDGKVSSGGIASVASVSFNDSACIYSHNENLNFQYKDSEGNLQGMNMDYIATQLNEQYSLLLSHNTSINNINSALQNKVSTNSEARLQGVHLSSSNVAYVYTEDDNINFRYKRGDGSTHYANMRNLAKCEVSGTTLNITLG